MHPFDPAPLIGDLSVTLDIDVLTGGEPGPAKPLGPAAIANLRAALFDMRSGNEEMPVASFDAMPIAALDLRDPIGAVKELERLAEVPAVRFFPEEQGIQPDFPSVRFVAQKATEAGKVILTGGDVRLFWRPLSGARVVFLDTHFYHLGDFLVVAADEPGFHTSTRLLTSPDALETVASSVGAGRLCYGSRAPYYEPLVPLLRLATSELSAGEKAMVAGGNARRLLGMA